MKRLSSLLFALVCAAVMMAQTITLSVSNQPIRNVLPQVEQLSGYHFFYNSSSLQGLDKTVTLNLTNASIESALNQLFAGSGITFKMMDNKVIALSNTQEKTAIGRVVTGTVYDETHEPIIGASVMLKHSTTGTITDLDGQFSIDNVKTGQYLQISFVGYQTYELRIADNTNNYSVTLRENTKQLDEVVVVGYGAQKKVNLTGAVGVASAKAIEARPVTTATQALQGVVPGLQIANNTGSLEKTAKINIRGTATIGEGSSGSPLVLIDGMEGDLNAINPQDIENISVLKDAAASSIYGSRAPFGVILVTTKSGRDGKTQVNYSNNFRWGAPIVKMHQMDSYTFAQE